MPWILSEPVADMAAAVDKLRVDDRLITDGTQKLNEVEAVLDAINGLHVVLVRKLREIYHDDMTAELAGRSTKNWLVEELGLSVPEAGRLLRLARELHLHPPTAAAFHDKQISAAHANAILTALNTLPIGLRDEVEPHLIERARFFPPEEIAGFLDELLQGLGIDKTSDITRERRHNRRGVDIAETLHGNRSLSGNLSPEVGAKLQAALDAACPPKGPEDDRNPSQRRHDALGEIADFYLAQQQPSFTGAPRTVIVTIDLDTLQGRLRETWQHTPHGPLAPDTLRRLACDAELIPIVLGGRSEVLDIGIADHEFTTAQRRAAYIRDRGACAFPHCRNKVVELHHIHFRRHGGPTSLHNAAWLCAFHHWLAHEGGWTLQRLDTGDYLWTSPSGLQLVRHIGTA